MDNLTPEQRRKNMQNIRSLNTKPEKIFAKELRKNKIYFRKNVKSILGKPDFVFRKKRIVVFIDSDFWHCNPKRFIKPKSNQKYWEEKIKRNRARDKFVTKKLKKDNWKVIRFWEYEINNNIVKCFNKFFKFYNI